MTVAERVIDSHDPSLALDPSFEREPCDTATMTGGITETGPTTQHLQSPNAGVSDSPVSPMERKPVQPRRRGTRALKRSSKPALTRSGSHRTERHAQYERLQALTIDPSSTFIAKYKDCQTGRIFERKERIPEAILPEEFDDYMAWRNDASDVEQKRKKQYLERPRKEMSKKEGQEGEEVWSRELDAAYQEAIRRVPPVLGKKKLRVANEYGGFTLYGRNMLISRVIYKLTGQTRVRKQISSHNQVLWNFPRKLPYARYTASLDTGEKGSRYVRIYDTTRLQWDEDQCRIVYMTKDPTRSEAMANAVESSHEEQQVYPHIGVQLQLPSFPTSHGWERNFTQEPLQDVVAASKTPTLSHFPVPEDYSPSNICSSISSQDSGYFSDLTYMTMADKMDFQHPLSHSGPQYDSLYTVETPCRNRHRDFFDESAHSGILRCDSMVETSLFDMSGSHDDFNTKRGLHIATSFGEDTPSCLSNSKGVLRVGEFQPTRDNQNDTNQYPIIRAPQPTYPTSAPTLSLPDAMDTPFRSDTASALATPRPKDAKQTLGDCSSRLDNAEGQNFLPGLDNVSYEFLNQLAARHNACYPATPSLPSMWNCEDPSDLAEDYFPDLGVPFEHSLTPSFT